jgi:imidazole glycerol-phosphate synthase subunit HisH
MIAIIEGCGTNIASIQYALERLGQKSVVTTEPKQIKAAAKVILPGVGHASFAMQQLANLQLLDVIRNLQQPVLGICLGMQLLFALSHEGNVPCLNIIPGEIMRFKPLPSLTIPHMGWNKLKLNKPHSALLSGIDDEAYVYFVHSYYAPFSDYTLASTDYGQRFSAVVQKDNFYGVQFHPERSSAVGSLLLQNFLNLG